MEQRRNDIGRGKPKNSEKNLPSAILSTTNPTWIDPGANPGLRGERLATNLLSHGTVAIEITSLYLGLMETFLYKKSAILNILVSRESFYMLFLSISLKH
jgi:hypothetical protein